jgi:predicted cupin superfamily sugar epimerase
LWHAGSPLALQIIGGADDAASTAILGPDVLAGQSPQVRVPARAWQAAEPVAGWTLVSCIVAPAFNFDGFELAPPDWSP